MRILNIVQCTNLGGMERSTLLSMIGLQARGHECRLLSLNPLGPLAPELQAHGIPAIGLPYRGRGGWRSLPLVRRTLRSIQTDAVIMHGQNLGAMLALGDQCSGRRVLCQYYHHTGVKPPWQWRLIYRLAARRFNAITFPSDFVRLEAEALCPRIRPLSSTLRDPFLLARPVSAAERACARAELGVPLDAAVVGNAGWLIPRKRFDVFLRVAARVCSARPGTLFLIAGDGPERNALRSLAAGLAIEGSVRWLGWQADLTPFYRSLDVLLFNSDWDAMARTPMEAMSHGVAVVASVRNGGIQEMITGPEFGFLTGDHDEEWLASRVVMLIDDAGLRERSGAAARARLAAFSDAEAHTDRLLELLDAGVPRPEAACAR
ncbi:MAG: glycosyltransferase [Bryobacteraceae bacterium]